MKYLKKYNESIESIESICKKLGIENYTINQDGSIDVNGSVIILEKDLEKLPLKFNIVTGDFYCYRNQLTSLEGGPKEVGGDFNCHSNQLTSLEGGPNKVGGNFYCTNNKLTSLVGTPERVDGNFYCSDNPIWEIFKLFEDYEEFKSLLDDFSYLRGTNIIKRRFEEACIDAGIKIPQKIKGYKYI